jgi:general secretion pathway protein I
LPGRRASRVRSSLTPRYTTVRRAGFSLLEVILALTLLAGAVVVLGEVCRVGLRNATSGRDLARAQMLCESKLAEIVSGITPPTSVENVAFDPSTEPAAADDSRWVYSVNEEATNEEGLIAVKVTVTKGLPEAQHPVDFTLVRWMPDPNSTQEDSSGGTSGSGSTNSSGGTSNGGS